MTDILDTYLSTFAPMRRARVQAVLRRVVRHNGECVPRHALIERKIAQGYTVRPDARWGRMLMNENDGAFLVEADISKTAMDYAEFLECACSARKDWFKLRRRLVRGAR